MTILYMDTFIKSITKQAGDVIKSYYGKIGIDYTKSDIHDVVTKADLHANTIIVDAIKKNYPNHGIISEETGEHEKDAEYLWIIDPLDGTNNFSRGIPMFAVMVALAYKGELCLSTIYDPIHEELAFAENKKGAYLNDHKIQCSSIVSLENSLGLTSARLDNQLFKFYSALQSQKNYNGYFLYHAIHSIAIKTLYIATGKADWFISHGGKIWDYAPSVLLLKEAGCRVTTFSGDDWKLGSQNVITANPFLYPTIFDLVAFLNEN